MPSPLRIVSNLDVPRVSWAQGYLEAAEKYGYEVAPQASDSLHPSLYIGDEIDWSQASRDAITGYFLAAVDGTDAERANTSHATMTTVPSQGDARRAESLLGADTHVDGFPVDFDVLEQVRQYVDDRDKKTVGFVGRTDADKGPDVELALVPHLRDAGFEVVHVSTNENQIAEELHAAGAEVHQNVSRDEYLARLATLGCLINTSPRESLFVTGIEASYFGVPVVAPRVADSGISDWNLPGRSYDLAIPQQAVEKVDDAVGSREVPHVGKYNAPKYFARIAERLEQLRISRERT